MGWQSYTSAVRANATPVFRDTGSERAREGGPDPLAAARATALVRSRGPDQPLAERLASLREMDDEMLRARFASLRLAPRSADYEAEKAEVRRIMESRGRPLV